MLKLSPITLMPGAADKAGEWIETRSRLIGSWSDRKSRLFTEAHVGKTINRLEELGWPESNPPLRRRFCGFRIVNRIPAE